MNVTTEQCARAICIAEGVDPDAVGCAMHTKYGELCGEINWQSPMCQKIKESW